MGCNAFLGLIVIKAKHGVCSAANLEGARFLKVFTFEEQLCTAQLVQKVRSTYRCAADERFNPIMCRQHVLVGRDIHVAVLHHAASF